MWSIEAHGRVIAERSRSRIAEAEVKKVLDQQKIEKVLVREAGKAEDKVRAAAMIKEDLVKVTREAQVQAFKRHAIAKQLREAWSK